MSGASGAAAAAAPGPLARFLPPLPPGMASAWLSEHVPPGGWVLDPLGASPALALEMARAGYRVLVASNNPILTFLLETLAAAPKTAEFQAALAELAVARRGDERLEQHIRKLYHTTCDTCGDTLDAAAFLWRRGEAQPYARLYTCPKCGESGERPIPPADLERLSAMGGDKLQRARALQRVILNEDENRADVEEALASYLPRALYVLFTLLNKAEGLGLPPERLRLAQALLLSLFDAGSTLWPYPGGRSRPKQLSVPPTFRENNLWLALEEAAHAWVTSAPPNRVPLVRWPEQPPREGGISIYRGRIRALAPLPPEIGLQAVVTVFPRPNQAFWTLSAVWAGWLWGAEAALPLRSVLDRRRYDWNWHAQALHSALAALVPGLPPETPCFGLLPELVPGFLSAVLVAAHSSGLHPRGLALRPEQDLAQAAWQSPGSAPAADAPPPAHTLEQAGRTGAAGGPSSQFLEQAGRAAVRAHLLARAEPAPYPIVYAAGLAGMLAASSSPAAPAAASLSGAASSTGAAAAPGDLLSRVQAQLARTFADRTFLKLYGGPAEEERGLWWLAAPPASLPDLPLADRVEMETVRFLQKRATFTLDELERGLCALFPGLLTPPHELVRACLESYAEAISAPSPAYRLRPSESAAARKADLQEMRTELLAAGQRLGYTVREIESPPFASTVLWEDGASGWAFYRMASSIISRFVLSPPPGPTLRRVIILPGGRAKLLAYKLKRDPRLSELVTAQADGEPAWRFLKFRQLREIAARPDLTRAGWEALIGEDPLTDEATQMPLFV